MFNYSEHGGYGYFDEEVAEQNKKYCSDCTPNGTYKWITAKSCRLAEPEIVEVTHVVPTHEGANGRYVATVLEWVR